MKHKVRVVLKKATNSLRLLANYSAERKTKKKNGTKKVRGRSKDKYHHTHSHTKAYSFLASGVPISGWRGSLLKEL